MDEIAHRMRMRRIDQIYCLLWLTLLIGLEVTLTGCATVGRPACDAALSVTAARETAPALPAQSTHYTHSLEVEPAITLTCAWSLTSEAR